MALVLEILVSAVAGWALTEVIRHGSIFAGFRGHLEARGGLLNEWVQCGFCFSHWAAMFTTALALICFDEPINWSLCARAVLVWLCATRVSNVMNDVFYASSRLEKEASVEINLPDPVAGKNEM